MIKVPWEIKFPMWLDNFPWDSLISHVKFNVPLDSIFPWEINIPMGEK